MASDEPVSAGSKPTNSSASSAESSWLSLTANIAGIGTADSQHSANDSTSTATSTSTTAGVNSFDSMIQNSLDRRADSTAADAPLSDQLINNPSGKHSQVARELGIQANLSQGVSGVTNREFTVNGSEIKGPVSFNKQGDQFLIDQSSGNKYRVLEGDKTSPNGYLMPVGRTSSDQTPLPVQNIKTMGGFGEASHRSAFNNDQAASTSKAQDKQDGSRSDDQAKNIKPSDTTGDAKKSNDSAGKVESSGADKGILADKNTLVEKGTSEDRGRPAEKGGVPGTVKDPMTADESSLLDKGSVKMDGQDRTTASKVEDRSATHSNISTDSKNQQSGELAVKQSGEPGVVRADDAPKSQDKVTSERPSAGSDAAPVSATNVKPGAPEAILGSEQAAGKSPQTSERGDSAAQPGIQSPKPTDDQGTGSKSINDTARPVSDAGKGIVEPVKTVGDPAKAGAEGAKVASIASTQPIELQPKPLPGANDSLGNPQVRQQFLDVLNQVQTGKFTGDQNSAQFRGIQDLSRMLGPEGLTTLRQNLQDAPSGSLVNRLDGFDPIAQQKIRDVFDTLNPSHRMNEATLTSGNKFNMEQFASALALTDKTVANRIGDSDTTRGVLTDLGRALKEFNTSNGIDPANAVGMRDVFSRTFEDPKTVSLPSDRKELVVNAAQTDESITRALMDRLAKKDLIDVELKKIETSKINPPLNALINTPVLDKQEGRDSANTANTKFEDRPNANPNIDLTQAIELGQRMQNQRAAEAAMDAQTSKVLDPYISKAPDDAKDPYKHKEEEKPKSKEDDHRLSQAEIDAAAAMALLNKKNKNRVDADTKETIAEKNKKEEEKRQKYIVKAGDTLESIAGKMLRDKRLSALIFNINSTIIKSRLVNGKRVPELIPNMVIWLPTPIEIQNYRVRLMSAKAVPAEPKNLTAEEELEARFGPRWDSSPEVSATSGSIEDMEDAARAAYKSRRAHIESLLGPLSPAAQASAAPKYVVRLGDSLKSVAVKHPLLQDVSLWKLIAEINRLSTKVDEKGSPLAVLRRGQALTMPTVEEIVAFKKREGGQSSETQFGGIELPTKSCPQCKRVTFASASLCPGCGVVFSGTERDKDLSNTTVVEHLRESVVAAEPGVGPPLLLASQLDSNARIMQSGTPDRLAVGYKVQLECNRKGQWIPIVAYEIFEEVSLRHEYKLDGSRRTIRIDLPTTAAVELAANDVKSNWQTYCDKFVSSRSAT